MMTAYASDQEKMRLLLAQGADINQTNKPGSTALYFAAGTTRTLVSFKGSTEAVKFLLQHEATVNHKSNINGYTALMAACADRYAGSVSLLLEYGEDVNAPTTVGQTRYLSPQKICNLIWSMILLDHGARVNGH